MGGLVSNLHKILVSLSFIKLVRPVMKSFSTIFPDLFTSKIINNLSPSGVFLSLLIWKFSRTANASLNLSLKRNPPMAASLNAYLMKF